MVLASGPSLFFGNMTRSVFGVRLRAAALGVQALESGTSFPPQAGKPRGRTPNATLHPAPSHGINCYNFDTGCFYNIKIKKWGMSCPGLSEHAFFAMRGYGNLQTHPGRHPPEA